MPWRCPVCGTENRDDVLTCKVCGAYKPEATTRKTAQIKNPSLLLWSLRFLKARSNPLWVGVSSSR